MRKDYKAQKCKDLIARVNFNYLFSRSIQSQYCLFQNNMNNKNTQTHNQNWRAQSYMEQSRNQAVFRPDNYYDHYSSPQLVNGYMHGGYAYPGMLPPYRPTESSHPFPNTEYANSFGMMSPEAYSRHYNKVLNYVAPDPLLGVKNYPNSHNFYQHTQPYKSSPAYPSVSLQGQKNAQVGSLLQSYHTVLRNNSSRVLENGGNGKDFIMIESDQDHMSYAHNQMKEEAEKVQVKHSKQQREMKLQCKEKFQTQFLQQDKKQFIGRRIVSPIDTSLPLESKQHILSRDQRQIRNNFFDIDKSPNFSPTQFGIPQIIPIQIIDSLKDQIMQELQTAQLPDNVMKLFLKYKTLQIRSKYQPNNQMSVSVFNSLRIYRAIIEFEKERKYFVDHILPEKIFGAFNFDLETTFPKTYTNDRKSQINRKTPNDRDDFRIKINLDQKKQKILQEESCSLIRQIAFPTSEYLSKTKKISKKSSSDHDSQDLSFNAKGKYEPNKNALCQRKLRERKKKKVRLFKYEKEYGLKQKQPTVTIQKEKEKKISAIIQNPPTIKDNKGGIQLSYEDEGLIEKIKGWAEKTVLADAIEEKHKKSLEKIKTHHLSENLLKNDSMRVTKKEEASILAKKQKDRSSKATQNDFKQMLSEKILQSKQNKDASYPNLLTFSTSSKVSEAEKEEFQKQLAHTTKQLRNNDSRGKIRVGKEYYQAKMPDFIQSQKELELLIGEKRKKLMERKMSVLTF